MTSRSVKIARATWQRSVPVIFSGLFFFAGVMLLWSGTAPALPERMHWLREIVPLSFIEVSHIIGSLTGVFLLFLARGVLLRLDAAYYGSLTFLLIGIITSLAKGFDWHEATILGISFLLFLPTRQYYYRKASLLTMSFTPFWIIIIGAALVWTLWEGLETYKHVKYADEIWLHFSYHEDAPRFLRAMLISLLTVVGYILYNAFNVDRPLIMERPSADDLEQARKVAGLSHDPNGFLALLGDKNLLWSKSRNAFIMYVMTARYWIAMGDPVGDESEYEDLVWQLREQADLYGARTVFYQVSDRFLPLYLDRGFIMIKLGEEARINLSQFTLDGGKMENQRKTRNRFTKNGFIMRILTPEEVAENLHALRKISDDWIAAKGVKEKSFSLGFFAEDYIRHTQVAVVEKDGVILAFANLWQLDDHDDISIDLMRYSPDAPPNTMEFLFVSTILWAKENGYRWFSLGMAPFAGMEEHQLAPFWHKVGRVIYKHGEDFYNFEGLHAYKSKFNPAWRPRYLASPPGPRVPVVLLSCAIVIAGGFTSIFRR